MATRNERNYEAMVILNPQLGQEETKALVEKLAGVLTGDGANLKETALWGHRRLAYPIQKKAEGYYVIFYFTLDSKFQALEHFERTCRYDENVMRVMVVKVPTKKRGREVAQIVPSPGYLADFKFSPRNARRKAHADRGGRYGEPRVEEADVDVEADKDAEGD